MVKEIDWRFGMKNRPVQLWQIRLVFCSLILFNAVAAHAEDKVLPRLTFSGPASLETTSPNQTSEPGELIAYAGRFTAWKNL